MILARKIKKAIDSYAQQDFEDALLYTTLAIDRASRNWRRMTRSSASVYKDFLRNYDWLIEKFGGMPLGSIKKQYNIEIYNQYGKKIGDPNPDAADLIYHIFRCNTHHCDEIPINYKLIHGHGISMTIQSVGTEEAYLSFPSRLILGLLAACAFNHTSKNITTADDYFLSYDSSQIAFINTVKTCGYYVSAVFLSRGSITYFPLKDWWGREEDMHKFVLSLPEEKCHSNLVWRNAGEVEFFQTYWLPH